MFAPAVGFVVMLLGAIACLILVPTTVAMAFVVVIVRALDVLRARRRRALAALPRAALPLRVRAAARLLVDGPSNGCVARFVDEDGSLTVTAPVRVWTSRWSDRLRRLELEVHAVVIDELAPGSFRDARRRRLLAPAPGTSRIEVFRGGRARIEAAVAEAWVKRDTWRFLFGFVVATLAALGITYAAAVLTPIGMG